MTNPQFFTDLASSDSQADLDTKLTATQAATQAAFAGADLTALKVELNAFLTKLKDAGIVASA